jgi:hypothetical protein
VQHAHGAADHAQTHRRGQSDEGIAAEPLAADDRLQQIGVGPVRELEIDRERRVEIGESFEHQGNPVETLRGEPREVGFGHELLLKDALGGISERANGEWRAYGRLTCASGANLAGRQGSGFRRAGRS